MQIFEVVEINEFPYMITKQIYEGEKVKDVLKADKCYLLVDHNLTRIWTYNGPKSSLKIQVFGARLAEMLNRQLQLKYNIYALNKYSENDQKFQEIMEKDLGGGIAEDITKSAFLEFSDGFKVKADTEIILDVNVNKALEYISGIPSPKNFLRKFVIVSGNVYTDEEITESFVKEQKVIKKPFKLGRLNRGFTAFLSNYATRFIIYDRRVQGLEMYIHESEKDKQHQLEAKIPIFYEEKFSKARSIDTLFDSFDIPDELPKEG